MTTGRRHLARTMTVALFVLLAASVADAQQSVSDVLSFLVTNRSIPTGDFERDEEAAIATRDTISKLLVLELATLPSSSGGGFTYRLDPTLGTVIRASDSFGPLFTERSLLAGRGRASFGMSFSSVTYDNVDGRNLRDGTLVSTASVFHGETTPFDIETVTLKFRTDTVTLNGTVGITDQLEVSAGIPFIRLNLEGERIDNYRGQQLIQARGSASTAGLGDIVVRARYNVYRSGASGMALGAEVRLPTGNEEDLLGTGSTSFTPRFIGSYEQDRVGVHGEIGYTLRGVSEALTYAGAVTAVAAPRLTLVGELLGRRLNAVGRLVETTLPHPRLTGVDTVRLTSSDETADRLLLVGGFKWNIASTWLLTANVLRPLTDVGLNASWVPSVTFDYWFD
ncbi:MAG TPA: transporter [Vicinamibacterales bacterium]